MVTAHNTRPLVYYGLSTDAKPTGITCGNGQKFIEIDTHKEFLYDEAGDQWYGVPVPETPEETAPAADSAPEGE